MTGPSPPPRPPRFEMLGTHVNAMTIEDMLQLIGHGVRTGKRTIIVSQNLHSIYTVHRDAELRALQEAASYVRIDGTPLVMFARLLGYPVGARHRTGWMDFMDPFMAEAAQRGWRVFYLGSRPGVAAAGADRLRARHPGVQLRVRHGHFDMASGEVEEVLADIADASPDVLVVGMGMPRQESFVLRFRRRLSAPVILTSGAAMDYVAGALPTPPRWLGPLGLEWAYRLACEPRRLWRRYLIEPWFAVGLFLKDLVRRGRSSPGS